MGEWGDGVVEYWSDAGKPSPSLQYSSTPTLRLPLSFPRQYAFLPRPNQSFHQQKQKDDHRDECAGAQPPKSNREGKQEDGLHIEDQEDDRIQVILDRKSTRLNSSHL